MKFKTGDEVVIRRDLHPGMKGAYYSVVNGMMEYAGLIAEVIGTIEFDANDSNGCDGVYMLNIDDAEHLWEEEWLSSLEARSPIKVKIKHKSKKSEDGFFSYISNGKAMLAEETDEVNHPAHYTVGGVECIDCIESALGKNGVINFCLGNSMKYLYRANHKGNKLTDLKKCNWYLNQAIDFIESAENN